MWLLLLPVRWVLAWKIVEFFWAVEFFRAWVFSKMLKKSLLYDRSLGGRGRWPKTVKWPHVITMTYFLRSQGGGGQKRLKNAVILIESLLSLLSWNTHSIKCSTWSEQAAISELGAGQNVTCCRWIDNCIAISVCILPRLARYAQALPCSIDVLVDMQFSI